MRCFSKRFYHTLSKSFATIRVAKLVLRSTPSLTICCHSHHFPAFCNIFRLEMSLESKYPPSTVANPTQDFIMPPCKKPRTWCKFSQTSPIATKASVRALKEPGLGGNMVATCSESPKWQHPASRRDLWPPSAFKSIFAPRVFNKLTDFKP